ncbi:hypothetical protein [uncultured Paraglaciecola sp.]|uniref:hypothetical protein n=1 Tax=uncultured Paraglaciecola sp. TaxID=1765024 RepID=UPI002612BC29|nr:hypothetical protein [uncultured Paraglaciecola sp.]
MGKLKSYLCLFLSLISISFVSAIYAKTLELKQVEHAVAELNFQITEGQNLNHFYRQGKVAAHSLLTSGLSPRMIFAFPAGNSGVSLWFEKTAKVVEWSAIQNLQGISQQNDKGQWLYGVEGVTQVMADELVVKDAILSSVRVLRDYIHSQSPRDGVVNKQKIENNKISWFRQRADNKSSYKLSVEVVQGQLVANLDEAVKFTSIDGQPIKLKFKALTGDKPLTPMLLEKVFKTPPTTASLEANILAYLSYEEKLLAGSWRFNTYFGRDTLMSLRLLMPTLSPLMIESALASVIERINQKGEVAHEEDIGEFAVFRQQGDGKPTSDKPIYDYKMIDDNYMLAPVIAYYWLEQLSQGQEVGQQRISQFLHRKTANGRRYAEVLLANFEHVVDSALPYARQPIAQNLIHLKPNHQVGQWRDSSEGLGMGKVPYDVNAVLVPAALGAIRQMLDSGIFEKELNSKPFMQLAPIISAWQKTSKYFVVSLPIQQAARQQQRYTQKLGLPGVSQAGLTGDQDISFIAVALDQDYQPVPVMHSDIGYRLLFADPEPAELDRLLWPVLLPFPQGLVSPVGVLVTNPIYASDELQNKLTQHSYHGTVVWSWHQALLVAGLQRQSQRLALPLVMRDKLKSAEKRLWPIINRTTLQSTAELWSWAIKNGEYQLTPFGQQADDKTESNAAQLWSTVYLSTRLSAL